MLEKLIDFYKRGRQLVPNEKKSHNIAFLMVLLATSLDNLNVSGTMTSYFSLSEHFDTSSSTVSWVLSAYSLTLGAFIIIGGKAADVFGPENVFINGLFIMGIFALLSAAVDSSLIAVIVFRAIQGIAGSLLVPCAFSFVGGFYPADKLSTAIGLLFMALTAVLGVGLVLGGAFSESSIGYKGLFYFTSAMSFVLSIGLYFLSPAIPRTEEHKKMKFKNLDFFGSVFLVIGLLLIILGLTEGGESWRRPAAYVPIPIGLMVVVAVILYETVYIERYKKKYRQRLNANYEAQGTDESIHDWRYTLEPLFPKEVISIKNFYHYLASTFLGYLTFIGVVALMIQYYIYVERASPLMAGVKSLPMGVGLAFGSLIYRDKVAKKIGLKLCMMATPLLQLTMSVWLSRCDFRIKNSYWKYEFISQFLFGYGTNIYFQVYWNAVLSNSPLHLHGVLSGILQTAGQIGICLGNAIIATILGSIVLTNDYDERVHYREKFQNCFYMAFAASAVMLLVLATTRFDKVGNGEDAAALSTATSAIDEGKQADFTAKTVPA